MKQPATETSAAKLGMVQGFAIPVEERLLYLVYFIYFFCGMTQSFESVILPELKEYFHLGYQQQMYVVTAKSIPFVFCPLLALFIQRTGYVRSLAIAMSMYTAGTALIVPGLILSHYWIVLLGFGIIGTGFTLQMIAGNPMISALGPAPGSSSRLNMGNALGAIAQIIAPALLSIILPATAIIVQSKMPRILGLLLVLSVLLALIAATTFGMRSAFTDFKEVSTGSTSSRETEHSAWRNPGVIAGACIIFLVLGAEASLFSNFLNFVESGSVASLSSHTAQRLFTLYFGLFAGGRLSAAWLQKKISPEIHLVISLAAALISLCVLLFSTGAAAVAGALALGFFVSIFFPTLYAIALRGAGRWKAQASGMLTVGFLGAAVVPVLQGRLADHAGLQRSYLVEAGIYLAIMIYAVGVLLRPQGPPENSASPASH
jgi:FHS family L-fucose permease-like MFS transporter